jgi:hypothetical protein
LTNLCLLGVECFDFSDYWIEFIKYLLLSARRSPRCHRLLRCGRLCGGGRRCCGLWRREPLGGRPYLRLGIQDCFS